MPTPAHALIAAVVDAEHQSQLRNGAELDTKAGLLLGVCGALIAVVGSKTGPWQVASLLLFAAGAICALVSVMIRPAYSIDPNTLRARYSSAPEEEIQLRVLDMRCDQYVRAATLLSYKTSSFLLGVVLVSLAVLGLVVNVLTLTPGVTP